MKHLKCLVRDNEYEIEWFEDAGMEFSRKEAVSKLMNEEFIKESLGTQSLNRIWVKEVNISGANYVVQCVLYGSLKKIIVTLGSRSFEIKDNTQIFKFIFDLQTIDIVKNPVTLIQSLELQKLIKSFFN